MPKKLKSPDGRQLCLIDWIEEQIRTAQAAKAKSAFNAEYVHGFLRCAATMPQIQKRTRQQG
jgi:hypothetical protein